MKLHLRVIFASFALLSALVGQGLQLQPRPGDAIPGLTPAQIQRYLEGRIEFEHDLGEAEGLGPGFNQTGCGNCHSSGGPGGAGTISVIRFGVAATGGIPFNPLANLGGSLLQSQAISAACEEQIPVEATVTTFRVTTPIFGAGFVEAIPDAQLLSGAQNPPPGVSGIAHMVSSFEDPVSSPLRVGRFGWKAQVATVLTFSADASLNELGLTNRFVTQENAPNGNAMTLAACDTVADPEDPMDPVTGRSRIDRQSDFQRFLAPPPQTPKAGMSGEALFNQVGCANCHTPSYVTGLAPESALTGQVIRPYSDFLLHDMGSLGDGIVQGAGTEREMKTAPLWGLRLRADSLLHNGSAFGGTKEDNVHSATLEHNGEGAPSRNAYVNLSVPDRDKIIAFLLSLGRIEFDQDGDNDVDAIDWFFIQPSITGPIPSFTANSPSAVSDIDGDGDIDLIDYGMFQRALSR